MSNEAEPSCGGCSLRSSCSQVEGAGPDDAPAGARLVGQSIAYFLLPPAAAGAAAMIAGSQTTRILAGAAAFVLAPAAVALIVRAVRRRRPAPLRDVPCLSARPASPAGGSRPETSKGFSTK